MTKKANRSTARAVLATFFRLNLVKRKRKKDEVVVQGTGFTNKC